MAMDAKSRRSDDLQVLAGIVDLDGHAEPWGGLALASNGWLHEKALAVLNSVSDPRE